MRLEPEAQWALIKMFLGFFLVGLIFTRFNIEQAFMVALLAVAGGIVLAIILD